MKDYLKWVFTRWYFYLAIAVYFYVNVPKEILTMGEYAGLLLGSFIVMFIGFSIVRLILWLLGKIMDNKS